MQTPDLFLEALDLLLGSATSRLRRRRGCLEPALVGHVLDDIGADGDKADSHGKSGEYGRLADLLEERGGHGEDPLAEGIGADFDLCQEAAESAVGTEGGDVKADSAHKCSTAAETRLAGRGHDV